MTRPVTSTWTGVSAFSAVVDPPVPSSAGPGQPSPTSVHEVLATPRAVALALVVAAGVMVSVAVFTAPLNWRRSNMR